MFSVEIFYYLGAGMQEFMDWGKWKTVKIGQRYISQSSTTKKKHASRLKFDEKDGESLLDTPYPEISREFKNKSFTDECIAASKKERLENAANNDDGINYKGLYFEELRKNQRKRKIDDIYDFGDIKTENERKRFKDNDGNAQVKGETHGLYYIEEGICYKESTEDAANKDGFYIYRNGKYYKRLDG